MSSGQLGTQVPREQTLRSIRSMGRNTKRLLSLLNSTAPQPRATMTNRDRNRFSMAPKREFHLSSKTAVVTKHCAHCWLTHAEVCSCIISTAQSYHGNHTMWPATEVPTEDIKIECCAARSLLICTAVYVQQHYSQINSVQHCKISFQGMTTQE